MRWWSLLNQYSQILYSVGSIVSKHFEYLKGDLKIYRRISEDHVLRFLPLFVFILAVLCLERIVRMLFDLCLNDFLSIELAPSSLEARNNQTEA